MSEPNSPALPPGKTCGDCHWFRRCAWLIQCKAGNTECDWIPSRFRGIVRDYERPKRQVEWA